MARLQRVFIDTSELFPFTIMDVLLTLSEDLLFTWVWTDELLTEWEEVIVREGQRTSKSAASVVAAVRTYFGKSRIDPAVYRTRIADNLSPDPADRIHAAAAVYGDVDVLITRNLKHLRTRPVLEAGIKVITSVDFLCTLLADRRHHVVASFIRAAEAKQNPPTTAQELASKVAGAGAPRFAERVMPHLARPQTQRPLK